MTPEHMESTLHSLITQQAQCAADLGALQGEVRQIAGAVITLTGVVGQVAEAQKGTDSLLKEHIRASAERSRELDERFKATDERLKATDEHLNRVERHVEALIGTLERHLSDGHGHGPKPS